MSAHLEPEDEPGEAADDEEDVPEPEDEVHLVDDDVEAEDAEGVERHLPPPGAVLVVGAARNLDRMRSLKTTNIIFLILVCVIIMYLFFRLALILFRLF